MAGESARAWDSQNLIVDTLRIEYLLYPDISCANVPTGDLQSCHASVLAVSCQEELLFMLGICLNNATLTRTIVLGVTTI